MESRKNMTEAFPESGRKYTLENLPKQLPTGSYEIDLNNKKVTLLVIEGVPYISIGNSAELVNRSRAGLNLRINKEEDRRGEDLRYGFGSLERYIRLETLKEIYFTPKLTSRKESKTRAIEQK